MYGDKALRRQVSQGVYWKSDAIRFLKFAFVVIKVEYVIKMYIYLNIYAMITIVIKNTTPAPTAPKTVSMFWSVFSDFDSTKSKLLYTGENKKSVKAKKRL